MTSLGPGIQTLATLSPTSTLVQQQPIIQQQNPGQQQFPLSSVLQNPFSGQQNPALPLNGQLPQSPLQTSAGLQIPAAAGGPPSGSGSFLDQLMSQANQAFTNLGGGQIPVGG